MTVADDIGPHTVPVPADDVRAEYLDQEAVLYDVRQARPVLLNVSASAVWAALDGVASVTQIAEVLAARFGADVDAVRRDVVAAVSAFAELGLLAVASRQVMG